jgi:hypothetical protein
MFLRHWRRAVAALGALALVGAAISPASAQLVHRNSHGQLTFNPLLCQTDYEIRRSFAAKGYTDIKLNAPIESQIQVRAAKGNRIYLIDYNFCLGRIDGITPLRAAR